MLTDIPGWARYKGTLARIAKAGTQLTRAQEQEDGRDAAAEQESVDALHAYDAARADLSCTLSEGALGEGSPSCFGAVETAANLPTDPSVTGEATG